MKPLRILLSAYQCGPGMGSVSQIGWEWYSRLARQAEVTLVTHIRNREALTNAGAPFAGSEILYIDTERFAGPLYRFASRMFPKSQHAVFLISSLDFFVYDAAALRMLRSSGKTCDLVHAVTPVSPVAATRLHRLGIPLIVGPWNGGLQSPRTFPEIMSEDSGWVYRVRDLGRLLDRVFGCTRNAALILTATKFTDRSLSKNARTRRMIENGVDLQLFQPAAWDPPPSASNPLRVLFVGRLIPAKGVSMLFDAVVRVRNEFPIHVTIVGDGPIRADLEREAAEKRLSGAVEFTGNLPLAEVSQYMLASHVFCLPSVRESGGAVLLEAEASALPIVAVNYGGPAELVDDEVGRSLSAAGREQLIEDLVDTFRDIVRNPAQWRLRGRQGRSRAEQNYGWDARIDSAIGIYRQVLETHV
jgi:glycosyltransferase involved in cell wall biosynthesis